MFNGEDSGLGSIQTIGIVNSLKTGNVLVDMILSMLIPVIIGLAMSSAARINSALSDINWLKYFKKSIDYHERRIEHCTVQTAYSTTDLGGGDSQNEVLIKAIQLYLDHKKLLKLKNAELELRQVGQEEKRNNYYYYNYDESDTTTVADTLSKYKVIKKPLKNMWLDLGKHGHPKALFDVGLCVNESKEDINKDNSVQHKHNVTLHFRSEGKDSIDVFIDTAYKWYLGQLRTLEDNSRYLYELKQSSDNDGNETSDRKYKRYQLSDEKTFDSLFFKEKETILNIVDNFTNKTGKYSIKGYPNKLGLLLHGPPGTGKTSLIKALAQLTGRSIVNVPLARISTNAELASLFFDQKYYVDGEKVPVKLSFKDIIFVMEDVDAVSKVVRRRDGKTTAEVTFTEQIKMPITKSLWTMMLESTDDECQELVKTLIGKSERLKEAAKDPTNLCSVARRMAALPGLSLVGEGSENETVSKVADEAIKAAQEQMEKQNIVNEFIGKHATTIKQMMDGGAEVTEIFENELLGISFSDNSMAGSFLALQKPSLSREVSYKKEFGDNTELVLEKSKDISDFGPQITSNDFELVGQGGNGKNSNSYNGGMSSWRAKRDELNLSGLLNVLDGVVDTPGRMLVMTTNHPEILDPALIRPGRIDKKLLLSYLRYEDLVQMLEHYFQVKISVRQTERLKHAVNEPPLLKLTPAQVEQLACEHEEVEDMISAIEKMRELLSLQGSSSQQINQIVYNS